MSSVSFPDQNRLNSLLEHHLDLSNTKIDSDIRKFIISITAKYFSNLPFKGSIFVHLDIQKLWKEKVIDVAENEETLVQLKLFDSLIKSLT
ncbi:MAG: hypothetical protein COT84_03675 [Chlamydiae bacterium CG10_big_fil_rev_8_21_14_0_10_35_9]|nr:MAG: hypothetical protein COT84_03675 [Chlamydiae bacterium CG10_big_fil_rev_8_21_14_0_10_35_9]